MLLISCSSSCKISPVAGSICPPQPTTHNNGEATKQRCKKCKRKKTERLGETEGSAYTAHDQQCTPCNKHVTSRCMNSCKTRDTLRQRAGSPRVLPFATALRGRTSPPSPHHVLDAKLLFLQSLLEGVRLSEISARVDENEPPSLRFEVAAIKTCPRGHSNVWNGLKNTIKAGKGWGVEQLRAT